MLKTSIKEAFSPLFLLVNTLSLFNLSWLVVQDFSRNTSLHDSLVMFMSYYIAILTTGVVGSLQLQEKLREKSILFCVTLVGAFSYSLAPVLIIQKTFFHFIIAVSFLGASLGITIPTCFAFFAEYSKIEGRGLLGAFILFFVQFFTIVIYMIGNACSTISTLLILAGWRFIGALSLFYTSHKGQIKDLEKPNVMIRDRSFILYFVPWFMFCLVNFIEAPLLERFFGQEMFATHVLIGVVIIGISAFLGGLLCDLKGRRLTGIIGFVLLGVSYALLNLFPEAFVAKISFMIVEGIAWGFLYVTFIFVIWGDLSEGKVREGYYLLGGTPFLLSGLIQATAQHFIMIIPTYTSFSLASFFLFLAVIPILYAPETLPEKTFKERELKSYIEKAKKVREKFIKS
jgi:MFS family permease